VVVKRGQHAAMEITYSNTGLAPFYDERALAVLLDRCFPKTFEGRIFLKQEPCARIVAHSENKLVGQVGMDRRVISVDGNIIKITGVIDLCVAEEYRGNGVGTALIEEVEKCSADRDFIVLMADNPAIYHQAGYSQLHCAPTKWLAIEDLAIHSIIERDLGDCFMYKPLAQQAWPLGKIDLLGYLF